MSSTLTLDAPAFGRSAAPEGAASGEQDRRTETFHWGAHFETGIAAVDEQHHALVDLINRFGDSLIDDHAKSTSQLQNLLGELAQYAQFHFAEEEALMANTGLDPRHQREHRQGHRDFIDEVSRMAAAIMDGHLGPAALLRFLTYWLAYHILGTDQLMADQIVALSAGQASDEAYAETLAPIDGATQPLLQSLNGLFRLVSERNRELAEANRTLEFKVAERTQALSDANVQLEEVARTDVLTGLPNRRHALARLQAIWSESSRDGVPLSCMMIDADGFKQVNDRYGHDAGDAVLRAISTALSHSVRTDDIVARLGGDEFLIICPKTPLSGATQVAELMRATVANVQLQVGDGGLWSGSVSIGVAERTGSIQSIDDLIKAADLAVYTAKRNGRNRVET